MDLKQSVDIAAPADAVWKTLMDVENWRDWTASITSIERLDKSTFGLGSQVRTMQPKLARAIWTVTRFEPGKSFELESKNPGARTVAGHYLEAVDGGTRVTLTIQMSGFAAALLQPFIKPLTLRYVAMEAEGLKKRCERQ